MDVHITQKQLACIWNAYKKVTGTGWPPPRLKDVQHSIVEGGGVFEHRTGSRWSLNSKLMITKWPDGLHIYLNPNCTPRNRTEKNEITKAEARFKKAAMRCL